MPSKITYILRMGELSMMQSIILAWVSSQCSSLTSLGVNESNLKKKIGIYASTSIVFGT